MFSTQKKQYILLSVNFQIKIQSRSAKFIATTNNQMWKNKLATPSVLHELNAPTTRWRHRRQGDFPSGCLCRKLNNTRDYTQKKLKVLRYIWSKHRTVIVYFYIQHCFDFTQCTHTITGECVRVTINEQVSETVVHFVTFSYMKATVKFCNCKLL